MKNICFAEECTGCTACYCICPHSAITFREDEMGFLYPVIDDSLCVDCGLCRKICPNNSPVNRSTDQDAYVATARSMDEQRTSTSGGLASVLARYVIHEGGVVYGCSGRECADVHHVRVQSEDEIAGIKGSKYVQSNLDASFKTIKTDLQNGIQVLFIGTPCQCAGLRSFLTKDYNNLLMVDFVCHGVPSQKILNDAIRYSLKQDDLRGIEVSFRYREGKREHSVYGLQLKKRGAIIYQKDWPKNDYITGFLKGVYYRESCYGCKYASPDRVSDITLGDYWDRDNKQDISKAALGLSSVIVNTDRGRRLFAKIKQETILNPIGKESLIKTNGQLSHPYAKSESSIRFKTIYVQQGYAKAYNDVLRKEMKNTEKALLRGKVNGMLRRVLFFKKV